MSFLNDDREFRESRSEREARENRERRQDAFAPLACAIRDIDIRRLRKILSSMDLKQRTEALYRTESNGSSALYLAIQDGTLSFLKELQEYMQIDYNRACTGLYSETTPLINAIRQGNTKLVNFLLLNKINIQVKPNHSLPPLAYAVYMYQNEKDKSKESMEVLDKLMDYIGNSIFITFRSRTDENTAVRKNRLRREVLKFCGLQETLVPIKRGSSFLERCTDKIKHIFMDANEIAINYTVNILEARIIEKFECALNEYIPSGDISDLVEKFCLYNEEDPKLIFSKVASPAKPQHIELTAPPQNIDLTLPSRKQAARKTL